jgi:hypothetical protein
MFSILELLDFLTNSRTSINGTDKMEGESDAFLNYRAACHRDGPSAA